MKVRLSNQVNWAAEFSALTPKQLESGSRWAWRKYVSDRGLGNLKLYLQVGVSDFWASSGQYNLAGKPSAPPILDHRVDRVASVNDWGGFFDAAQMCFKHATQVEGIISTINKTPQVAVDTRRNSFKIVS